MSNNTKVVIAYASIWNRLEIKDIPHSQLTHINFSFLNIDSDGHLIFGDEGCDECCAKGYLNNLMLLKSQQTHLKIHLSIGGASWEKNFMPVSSNTVKRATLVSELKTLLEEYGLNGVDLDWEFVQQDQGQFFEVLAKDLRSSFGNKYELTTAVPSCPSLLQYYNLRTASQYFNWINLMTYDASVGAGYSTHHAPLYKHPDDPIEDCSGDTAVKYLNNLNISNNKLVLGIPLYGYQYKVPKNDPRHGLFLKLECNSKCETSIASKDLPKDSKFIRYMDPIAKAPYLYNSEEGLFITFEDKASAQFKIDYVNSNNLKGIMFWELQFDYSGSNSVISTVYNQLNITKTNTEVQLKYLTLPSNLHSLSMQ